MRGRVPSVAAALLLLVLGLVWWPTVQCAYTLVRNSGVPSRILMNDNTHHPNYARDGASNAHTFSRGQAPT